MNGSPFFSLVRLARPPFLPPAQTEALSNVRDWAGLLRLADVNRVLLILFQNLEERSNLVPALVWTKIMEETSLRRSVWSLFSEELARIGERLESAGLRWMLVKTVRGFPREIRDLDMLLFDNRLDDLLQALAPIDYKQSGKVSGFKTEMKTRRPIENKKNVAVTIDVHSRISYEGLTFVQEEDLWRSRRTITLDGYSIPIPSHEYQLITTALNSFFGDGGVRLTDVYEYAELMGFGVRTDQSARVAQDHGWSSSFQSFARMCQPYVRFLMGSEDPPVTVSNGSLCPELPRYFDLASFFKGLGQKAIHDIAMGGRNLAPSYGRLGMKFLSVLGRDRLRKDSWNEIFKR